MDDVSSPPPGKSPTAVARWKTASRFIGAARKFRQSLEPANRRKEATHRSLVFGEIKEQVGKMAFWDLGSSWKVKAIMVSRVILPGIIVVFLCSFGHSVWLSRRLWFISIFVGSTTTVLSFLLKSIPVEKEDAPEDHDCYQPLASSP